MIADRMVHGGNHYMKQIGIIMAVYNGAAYLQEQIDSLLQNTNQNFILHIFDDNSSDDSWLIISQYTKEYPKRIFGYRHNENYGVVRSFLEGAKSIDADYYMFCDQDDVWLPDKIAHTLAQIEKIEQKHPHRPAVVFGDAKVVDQELKELTPSFQRQSGYQTDALDLAHLLMENKLIGCTILFNRELQQMLHPIPYQSIRMHDWWIALLGAAFGCISYLDEPLLLYRQHSHNVVGGSSRRSYIRNRITHLSKQRQTLYRCCEQAAAFLECFETQLMPEQQKLIQAFATIPQANWFARRYRVIRYHFYKSGFIRNLGVLLVI